MRYIIINNIGKLLKETFKEWFIKDPFRQSAVIAYYAVFSIPGLLFLVVTLTGYFFEKDVVSQSILTQVSSTMGVDIAAQIEGMLIKASEAKSTFMGSLIGIVILLVGATGVFVELQKSLNQIWKVKVVPKKGIILILKSRLFSFGLILAIAFLLLISLVISTALAAMGAWIKSDASGFMVIIFNIFNFAFSLAIISALFALMFKILPDAKIKWNHVWLGSVVAGSLFTIGKTALAFYFGTAHPASVYGTAGSIILILLWVSYSSMIMFFGAEFTAAYARMYSGKVPPTEIAKPI
ncbi:MAG: ribonuclease BN [Bacteroidetes bacterium GWF2_40_14]|nr:MAG: ribonuclease BN [Bacteroidetes bacterium GWF2_40_14]